MRTLPPVGLAGDQAVAVEQVAGRHLAHRLFVGVIFSSSGAQGVLRAFDIQAIQAQAIKLVHRFLVGTAPAPASAPHLEPGAARRLQSGGAQALCAPLASAMRVPLKLLRYSLNDLLSRGWAFHAMVKWAIATWGLPRRFGPVEIASAPGTGRTGDADFRRVSARGRSETTTPVKIGRRSCWACQLGVFGGFIWAVGGWRLADRRCNPGIQNGETGSGWKIMPHAGNTHQPRTRNAPVMCLRHGQTATNGSDWP